MSCFLRFLFLAFSLTLACCNKAPEIDNARIEQIISEYIDRNPIQIARAAAMARQNEQADLIQILADQDELVQIGPDNPTITIIEFFDYNCGFCKRALDWVIEQLERGDTRVIFVETPILEAQTGSSKEAALASLASSRQDRFLEMHEALMRANRLETGTVLQIAETLKLDIERFQNDMQTEQERLEKSLELAELIQLQGTPGFFVNGKHVHGFDLELLDSLVAQIRSTTVNP